MDRRSGISKQSWFRNAGPRAFPRGLEVESQGEGSPASADQPISPWEEGVDSPRPCGKGTGRYSTRKGRCPGPREAWRKETQQRPLPWPLLDEKAGQASFPSGLGGKRTLLCPGPHSQAVLTTFSPTGWHLAPLPHPTSPSLLQSPMVGLQLRGGAGAARACGGGGVREFPHSGRGGGSLLSVGGGVLGRWAGSQLLLPGYRMPSGPFPHLLPPTSREVGSAPRAGECRPVRGGGGGDSRLWLQSPIKRSSASPTVSPNPQLPATQPLGPPARGVTGQEPDRAVSR